MFSVAEQDLTEDLRRLAGIVWRADDDHPHRQNPLVEVRNGLSGDFCLCEWLS